MKCKHVCAIYTYTYTRIYMYIYTYIGVYNVGMILIMYITWQSHRFFKKAVYLENDQVNRFKK